MIEVLRVENIIKCYGNKRNITRAIDNISFNVCEGEFVGIMGPSGSGKTTLLNCISTIDRITSGKIIIDGDDISKFKMDLLSQFRQNELGFIFQDYNLLDTLTAYENIALALTIKGEKSEKIKDKVRDIASHLDIQDILSKYPYEMSGGEKQRVACARAIVKKPTLLLADEPTGALDSQSSKLLLEKFEILNKEFHNTILMVTHDAFTASFAERILFIKDGKLFKEIQKGQDSKKEFFNRIMDTITTLGGDDNVF